MNIFEGDGLFTYSIFDGIIGIIGLIVGYFRLAKWMFKEENEGIYFGAMGMCGIFTCIFSFHISAIISRILTLFILYILYG